LKLNQVGIDVSAKVFTVVMDHEGDRTEAFDLPNDALGHKKLIRMATRNGFHAKVVLEATGVYSLDLALALHRAKRVEVMVANPRAISQFAGACLRRSKTDSLDANIIVEFGIRMDFDVWVPPEPVGGEFLRVPESLRILKSDRIGRASCNAWNPDTLFPVKFRAYKISPHRSLDRA